VADKKITALTAYTNPISTDLLPIYDITGSETKKITYGNLIIYPGVGIPLSTGSAWGTSITDNSAHWNSAYGWGNWASNFGTSVGTIAQGNDSRINHGETAYGWGNHSGLYLPIGGGTLTGDLALTTHNITLTGSLAATANRVLKGWFTDIEITNLPTINGGTLAAALGNYGGFLTSVTAHNLLSTTHGDTTADTVVRGDLMTGQGSTPKWARLAFPGTPTGKVLICGATDVGWSSSALGTAAYAATGDFLAAAGTAADSSKLGGTAANGYALVGQTMYIGTTGVAINRGSAALTLAGITLTTPDIGTPSAGTLTSCTGLPAASVVAGSLVANMEASDHGTGTTDMLVNVSYGTSATPPTASSTTEGSLYIQYTN
jgi:hypothetical protein